METTIPITRNMVQMIKGMSEQEKSIIGKQIIHFINQYKKLRQVDTISTAVAFHEAMDKDLRDTKESGNPYYKRIACQKGCGFCCYVNVDINEDEAELIIQYCKEENIPIDIDLLKKQQDKNDKTYMSLTTAERKCNFLADDMTCKIYKHRPGACRKFNALDTNKICKDDSLETHPLYASLMLEILQTAIYEGTRTASMPKLILEKLI